MKHKISGKFYPLTALLILILLVTLGACGGPSPTSAPAATTQTATTASATTTTVTAATTAPAKTTAIALPTVTSLPAKTPAATAIPATTKPVTLGPGKIVFDTAEPNSAIYVVNPDGTGLTKVADGKSPLFSPDGKQVAYWTLTSGELGSRPIKSVIRSVNLADSSKQDICTPKQDYVLNLLRWSPRGRYIAYTEAPSNTDAPPKVGQCSTVDKKISEVTRSQGGSYLLYDWSADGDNAIWLAGPDTTNLKLYYGDPDKGGAGAVELAKGLNRIPENPFISGYETARFSPDGKTIALFGSKLFFVSVPGQKSPLEGRSVELGPKSSVRGMAFSPDGKTLAISLFTDQAYGALKLIDLGDNQFGKISDVANGSYKVNHIDWSRQ